MKYTYLIKSGNIYKIGESENPQRRLSNHLTSNPHVQLICYGYGIREKELHKIFSDKRLSGEWFNLSVSDVDKAIQLIIEDNVRPEVWDRLEDIELLKKLKSKWNIASMEKAEENPGKYPKSYAYYEEEMGKIYMNL